VNKALLDTDIYSEVLKAKNPTVAQNAALYHQQHGVYTVSVITVMEVVQGFHRVQNARRLLNFLNAVGLEHIIVFDRSAAELAGRISGDLERTGQNIGLADPMIAAIALQHGLELVTGNTAHFQRIQQLGYPLTLANWRICGGPGWATTQVYPARNSLFCSPVTLINWGSSSWSPKPNPSRLT
jgi:predicted nucleic acid-binding protein